MAHPQQSPPPPHPPGHGPEPAGPPYTGDREPGKHRLPPHSRFLTSIHAPQCCVGRAQRNCFQAAPRGTQRLNPHADCMSGSASTCKGSCSAQSDLRDWTVLWLWRGATSQCSGDPLVHRALNPGQLLTGLHLQTQLVPATIPGFQPNRLRRY